jgi:hypothetical protein
MKGGIKAFEHMHVGPQRCEARGEQQRAGPTRPLSPRLPGCETKCEPGDAEAGDERE